MAAVTDAQSVHAFSDEAAAVILVVAEDPLLSRTIVRLLRRAGYQVATRDHDEDLASTSDPALVILDEPDERLLAKPERPRIRPAGPETPILWISNRPGAGRRVLVKPFSSSDLLRAVAATLHKPVPLPIKVG